MTFKTNKGFSLVELMIVVAIIGILSAVAIPNFTRFQVKARQAEARADLSAIYLAQKAFKHEWQQYYDDFIETGYSPEGSFRYEHGFTAGVNSPVNYTGMIGAMAAATRPSTAMCGTAPAVADFDPNAPVVNCSVDRAPTSGAPAALAAATLTTDTFVAAAVGNIDSDTESDSWSINDSKSIFGPCSMATIPCTLAGTNGGDLDN